MVQGRLAHQATQLEEALHLYDSLTSESSTLLKVLERHIDGSCELLSGIKYRATALTHAQHNISHTKASVDELLERLDTSRRLEVRLRVGPSRDLEGFLSNLEELRKASKYLEAHDNILAAQQAADHMQVVYNKALNKCEADFVAMLGPPAFPPPLSANWLKQQATERLKDGADQQLFNQVPGKLLVTLRRLSTAMIEAGSTSCIDKYILRRQEVVGAMLRSVGFEMISLSALQLQTLDQLEKTMQGWSLHLRVLVLVVLAEQRLSVAIWLEPHDEAVFSEIVGRSLRNVLQIGRDTVEAKRSPERLFALLDMHKNIMDVTPLLEAAFLGRHTCVPLLNELKGLASLLQRFARSMWSDFEDSIRHDPVKLREGDLTGTVHPLCAAVMQFLKRLMMHPEAAEVLFASSNQGSLAVESSEKDIGLPMGAVRAGGVEGLTKVMASDSGNEVSGERAALGSAVMRLLLGLHSTLDAKARELEKKSRAISALFSMNNISYMVSTVEGSPAAVLLGEPWVDRYRGLVEQHAAAYRNIVWTPIIANLISPDPQGDGFRDSVKQKLVIKEKMRSFNAGLENVVTQQGEWSIPDKNLRAATKQRILQDLLPPYEAYIKKVSQVEFSRHPLKYLRYTPRAVNTLINEELFSGKKITTKYLENYHSK